MTKPSSELHRRFADARELLGDLLDRYEGGHRRSDRISALFRICRRLRTRSLCGEKLQEAEAAGAIRIAKGLGDQIAHVRLVAVSPLYDLLGHTMTATSSAEQFPQPPVLGEVLLVLFCPKNHSIP
jgi:hypothetical protein